MSPVFRHGGLRLYLLDLLDAGPKHGYELMVDIEDRFLGSYSPSAGTIYPRLARLEAEGLVEHEASEGRKVYRLTAAGRAELTERGSELVQLERELAGSVAEVARELRRQVGRDAAELKSELKAAGRQARHQRRVERRGYPDPDPTPSEAPRASTPSEPPGAAALARTQFAAELADTSRRLLAAAATADTAQLTAAKTLLSGALDAVLGASPDHRRPAS